MLWLFWCIYFEISLTGVYNLIILNKTRCEEIQPRLFQLVMKRKWSCNKLPEFSQCASECNNQTNVYTYIHCYGSWFTNTCSCWLYSIFNVTPFQWRNKADGKLWVVSLVAWNISTVLFHVTQIRYLSRNQPLIFFIQSVWPRCRQRADVIRS